MCKESNKHREYNCAATWLRNGGMTEKETLLNSMDNNASHIINNLKSEKMLWINFFLSFSPPKESSINYVTQISWCFDPCPVLVTGGHISETPSPYLVWRHIFLQILHLEINKLKQQFRNYCPKWTWNVITYIS